MKFIIFILLAFITSGHKSIVKEAGGCLQMDIMLLGDFSSSVHGYESFVAKAFAAFAKQFELSENGVKIGVVTFTSIAEVVCPLTSDRELLRTKVDSLDYFKANGNTNMFWAFSLAKREFQLHGREGFKKMMIVVSDGEPNLKTEVKIFAQQIKRENINICGVLIVKNMWDEDSMVNYMTLSMSQINGAEFMKEISGDCYVESDYQNLITEIQKLSICL